MIVTDTNTVHVFFVYDTYPPSPDDGYPIGTPIGYFTWRRCTVAERPDASMDKVFDFDARDSGNSHSIANVNDVLTFTEKKLSHVEAIKVVTWLYSEVQSAMKQQPQNWSTPQALAASRL